MLSLGFGLTSSTILGRRGFSPLSLFAASEPGAWYDPSDLSTLYQDAAGTVPVAAAGQTVGLVLDKSKGLVLGPELVTNGGFASNVNGWTNNGTGSFVWSNGAGQFTRSASTDFAGQAISTTAGRSYLVIASGTKISGLLARIAAGPVNSITSSSNSINSAFLGTGQVIFTATGATSYVCLGADANGTVIDFDNISVRELPGNHATQATAASRPLLQQDATGRYFLLFDGTDDFLVTPTITPGTDKAQVFAGVRKLSDASSGIVVEHGATSVSNNGSFTLVAPWNAGGANYAFASRGTIRVTAISAAEYTAPITNVLTGIGDISGERATLRVNGTQAASNPNGQGTGDYLAYPLYIGRRNGTLSPLNGRLYGLIARFGPNLSDAQITQVESWLNSKTGAY